MAEFTNKTQFHFDPLPAAIDVGTSGIQYTTPLMHREKLADLSRLRYLRAEARFTVRHGAAGGEVTAAIRTADTVLGSQTVNLINGDAAGAFEFDLSNIAGTTGIYWEVNVLSTGAGTATFAGVLNVESPLIISA